MKRVAALGFAAALLGSLATQSPAGAEATSTNAAERLRSTTVGSFAGNALPVHVEDLWPKLPGLYDLPFGSGARRRPLSFPSNVRITDMYESEAGDLFLVADMTNEFAGASEESKLFEVPRRGGAPVVRLEGRGAQRIHGISLIESRRERAVFEVYRSGAGISAPDPEIWMVRDGRLSRIGRSRVVTHLEPWPGDCVSQPANSNGGLPDGFALVARPRRHLVSTAEARAATQGLLTHQGAFAGCRRLGDGYIAWINSIDAYSDGVTFRVTRTGTMIPLFRSYPKLQTHHFVLFAENPESGIFRYLLIQQR